MWRIFLVLIKAGIDTPFVGGVSVAQIYAMCRKAGKPLIAAALFLTLLAAGDLRAQFGPLGGEFRANSYTISDQVAYGERCVAMDDGGNFVVVWTSYGQDGSGPGVFAQRFSNTGAPLGSEFPVNNYTANHQHVPAVAMDSDGDFVVVWHGDGQGGAGEDVYARQFTNTGAPAGNEFRVNVYSYFDSVEAAVAMDANGNFVIVWTSIGAQDGSYTGVFGRRYTASGATSGNEFQVNTYSTGAQQEPSVGMDDDGDFVVAWTSDGQASTGADVFAQRYDNTGVAVGGEFLVNTALIGKSRPSVGIDDDGDFVITWENGSIDVRAQRYDNTGAALGSEFVVNTSSSFPSTNVFDSSVSMDGSGNFIVCWGANGNDGSGYGVYGQRFAAGGATIGGEFLVNTYTTNDQRWPSVAMSPTGNFVVAWGSSTQDGGTYGVYAQMYGIPPPQINLTTSSLAFVEDDPATALDGIAVFTAPATNLGSGYLLIEHMTSSLAEDDLLVLQTATVRRNGTDVEYDASGSFTGGQIVVGTAPTAGPDSGLAGEDLLVSFNSACTPAVAEQVLRAVAYHNPSQDPLPTTRTLRFAIDDGVTGTSNQPTLDINVAPVNDAPGFTASNPPSINEDAGLQLLSNWALFSPGPGAESGQVVQAYIVSGLSNPSLFSLTPTVDLAGNLSYAPAQDANGTCTFDVVVVDNGGTVNGGVNTSVAQGFTISVSPANDAPTLTVVNTLTGGGVDTPFSIPFGVLAAAGDEGDVDSATIEFRIEAILSGTLVLNGSGVTPGNSLLGPGDALTWTPSAGQTGTISAITIVAHDGVLASAPPVSVNVVVSAPSGNGDNGNGGDEGGCSTQTSQNAQLALALLLVAHLLALRNRRRARADSSSPSSM